jgi:processive 1,2-diacylglycerol beta-glucosyltransferase
MRVLILSAPVGAGHDAAARGVADELRARGAEVEIDNGLALMGTRVHRLVVDGYRWELEHAAWTWRVLYRITRSPRLIRMVGWALSVRSRRRMLGRIEDASPDRVISTYPLVSAVLAALRRSSRLSVPCSALITDFDPHPAWVHPDLDANLSVSDQLPGLVPIRPPVAVDAVDPTARQPVRQVFGIPPDARVVLIVGGAWGVGNLEGAAVAVAGIPGAHAIVVTGRNDALKARLRSNPGLCRHATILGFVDNMPDVMAASDLLIQNAGGLTCLEGFAARLPVVMFEPLPGHGEDNSRQMADAGLVALTPSPAALRTLLADELFWTETGPAQVARAHALFERPCAADELEAQLAEGPLGPLVAVRRSLRPVLGTFSAISVVAMTRAPDALGYVHHFAR